MSIENKLREIVRAAHRAADERGRNDDLTIMQLIEAFESEGWRHVPTDLELLQEMNYLSGQEWYSKFEKELDKHDWTNHSCGDIALEAAKKASGLKT